jgi:hypothetical protein
MGHKAESFRSLNVGGKLAPRWGMEVFQRYSMERGENKSGWCFRAGTEGRKKQVLLHLGRGLPGVGKAILLRAVRDKTIAYLGKDNDWTPGFICTVVQCSIYDAAMQRNMKLQGG